MILLSAAGEQKETLCYGKIPAGRPFSRELIRRRKYFPIRKNIQRMIVK